MKNLIVGLASPARGGKDMVADVIERELHFTKYAVKKLRFADPLKDITAKLFGWDRDRLDSDTPYKETPDCRWGLITPRKALQLIGTEMFRDGPLYKGFGINMWLECMRDRLEVANGEYTYLDRLIIIPDCRFRDEFRLVKDMGGVMVFMDPRPRIEEPDHCTHPSEWDMWHYEGYDHVIDTGGTMTKTELEARVMTSRLLDSLRT